MPSPRHSNVERRRERDNCRLALSRYIMDERLGIAVTPSEVRLNPRPLDGYSWKACPGHESFFDLVFAKNLSDQSISTYRLLARHVGKTFEAVSAEASEESANLILSPSSSKLYAENEQLRTENLSLSQQVQQLSDALEKETEQKLTVASQNEELRQDLQSAKETIIQRTDEVLRYQTALSNWFRELDKAMPALDDLRHTMIEGATM
ncbi:hypothetical protein MY1884_007420 [Beauveria asiatica]